MTMKNMKKMLAAAMMLVLALALTACGKEKVDLTPFVELQYRGGNGNAQAALDFDFSDFEHTIMLTWPEEEQDWAHMGRLTDLEASMDFHLSKSEGLSNGDEIQVEITYDAEKADLLEVELTGLKQTVKVENLPEALSLDPFDPSVFGKEVTLELTGISPRIRMEINNAAPFNSIYRGIEYGCDKRYEELKNGDTITLTVEYAPETFDGTDVVLTRKEMTVTVDGFPSYVTDPAMITPENLEVLRTAAKKAYDKETGYDTSTAEVHIGDYKYDIGLHREYHFWDKMEFREDFAFEDAAYANCDWNHNYRLILPYSFTARNLRYREKQAFSNETEEVQVESMTLYGYVGIRGLIVNPDGSLEEQEGQFHIDVDDTALYDTKEARDAAIMGENAGFR